MPTPSKGTRKRASVTPSPAAAGQDLVVLNVAVKRSTRNGLNRLKLMLGLPNQGAVLAELVRLGLATAKGR
ncbi:MAG: hypothetical protein E6R14_06430 [Thermomicrobiales bacterium]|nr:MAG: hypothetical protein E6R14_06430 [Thermomicrobiales bacterium]